MSECLLAIGDVAVDILVEPHEAVATGTDARGRIEYAQGGSAANVAVWAARLSADSSFAGAVGCDPWGDWLLEGLAQAGVRAIASRRGRTAAIVAQLDEHGERTFITDRATALDLREDDLPDDLLVGIDALHVPAYSLFEGSLALAAKSATRRARALAANCLVSIDLSSSSQLRRYGAAAFRDLLAQLRPDVLFGNFEEAQALWGVGTAEKAANAMCEIASIAVVKRGKQGVLVASRDVWLEESAPIAKVVDTTGAGDALAAAFLVSYLRSHDPVQAARTGVRLAALVVQHRGARPSISLEGFAL